MMWNLNDEELNLISGGARKLGLTIQQPSASKVHSRTKPGTGEVDDGPDTSGNFGQNPSDGDPDSIF